MKNFFRTDRIWFKAVAILVICLFLFNEHAFALEGRSGNVSLNTLSPVSRFKPVVEIEKKGDDFVIIEDLGEKTKFSEGFREDMGFVYLNLLISQVLEKYQDEISAQGLKRLIEKHLAHVDFTRYMWRDMYKEGNAFCLPYSSKDGENTYVLRYFLPSGSEGIPASGHSVATGVGNARFNVDYFRESEEAIRIMMALASLGHSSNKRTNMMGSLSNLLQYAQFVLRVPLEEDRFKEHKEAVEEIFEGVAECANLFSSLYSKAQNEILAKRNWKKPFNEKKAVKRREKFSAGVVLFKRISDKYFAIRDDLKNDLPDQEKKLLLTFEKHLRFLAPLLEDRRALMNGKVASDKISINDVMDNIFDYLETSPYDQALGADVYIDRIKINLPEEEVFIEGNEISITSLLCNLIDDSLKYAIAFDKDKAETIVDVRVEQDRLLIEIRDNGIGIEEKELAKLSDDFYTTGGTGIGLTEARIITKDHQGDLQIGSRHISSYPQSHGTTFKLSLPVTNRGEEETGDNDRAHLKLPTPRGHIKQINRKIKKILKDYCRPMEEVQDNIVPEEELSWRSINAHLRKNGLPAFAKQERPVLHVIDVQDKSGEEFLGFPLKVRAKFSDLLPVVSYLSEKDGRIHVYVTAAFFDDYLHISHLRSSRSQRRLQSLRLAEIFDHERYELSEEAKGLSKDARHYASAMRARHFVDKGDPVSCFHKWALDNFALTEDGRKHIELLLDEHRKELVSTEEKRYEKAFYEYARQVLPRKQFSSRVQRLAHHLLRIYMHGDTKAFEQMCEENGLSAEKLNVAIEEEERRHVLNAFEGFSADKVITHTHETDVEIDHSKSIVRKTPKREAPESAREGVLESYKTAQDRLGGLIADFTIIDGQIYQEKVRPLSDYYIDLAESKGEFAWMKDAPDKYRNSMAKDIMQKHLDCIMEIAKRGVVLGDAKPANFGIRDNGEVVLLDMGASSFYESLIDVDAAMGSWLLINTFRFENIVPLAVTYGEEAKYEITDPEIVGFFGKKWARIWVELISDRIVGDDEEIIWRFPEDGQKVREEVKALFPRSMEEAEKEYRRITYIPTEFAKEEILNIIMHELTDDENDFLPGFSRLWDGPSSGLPRGSIGGIFEFLCDMNITGEEAALTEEEIAYAVERSEETIDSDIRALYFHLHLIKAANPGEGKDERRYYVPEEIAAKREQIEPVLLRFQKGTAMLRPSYDVLDQTYERSLKGVLEKDQKRPKRLIAKLFFPWKLSPDSEEIRTKYGDPKIRMLYYLAHYAVWTIGILPYIIIISSAALSKLAGVSEPLKSTLSGPLTKGLYDIGMELSEFVEIIVYGTLSGDRVSAAIAVMAIIIPILLFSISTREHRKLRKALKEETSVYSSGAYRFSRHPQYFLSLCAASMVPVICPTLGMVGVFVLFLISMNVAIFLEEVIVWMDMGDAYLKYREETPARVIPSERTYFILYLLTEITNMFDQGIKLLRAIWIFTSFGSDDESVLDDLSEDTESPGAKENSTSGIKRVVMDGKVVSFQAFTERIQTASTMGCIFNAEIEGDTLHIGFRPRIIDGQQQYHHFIKAPRLVGEKTFRSIINGGGADMDVGILLPQYPEDKTVELRDAYIRLARVLTEYGFPGSFGIYRRKGDKKDQQLFKNPPSTFKDLSSRGLSTEDEGIIPGIAERTIALSLQKEPEGALFRERMVTVKSDKYGVHARPAFEISKIMGVLQQELGVEVYIEKADGSGKRCSAESYNELVGMSLQDGEKILLKIYISERDKLWDEDAIRGMAMMVESVFRQVEYIQEEGGRELYVSQAMQIKVELEKRASEKKVKSKKNLKTIIAVIGTMIAAIIGIIYMDDLLGFIEMLWEMIRPATETGASGLERHQASAGGVAGILGILLGLREKAEEEMDPESAPHTVYVIMRNDFAENWTTAGEIFGNTFYQYPEKHITFQDVEKTIELLVELDLVTAKKDGKDIKYKATGLSPPEWEKVEPLLRALEYAAGENIEDEFSSLEAECIQECDTDDVWSIETICAYNSSGKGSSGREEEGIVPSLWALQIIHYIEMIEPEAEIADLGSADGKFCFLASRYFRSVTGFEAGRELYRAARASRKELIDKNPHIKGIGNVKFKNADFLDKKTDLSPYDILYFFYAKPRGVPTAEYNEILLQKLTGPKGMKPGARLIVLGAGSLDIDSSMMEDESVNMMGMRLGVYKRKRMATYESGEREQFIKALNLSAEMPRMCKLTVLNGRHMTLKERQIAAKGLAAWMLQKKPGAAHYTDINAYTTKLRFGTNEELQELYFVFGSDGKTVEGWIDLSFRKTTSALEIAPWNREAAGENRRYKGIGSELRAFAIKRLKEKYGDSLYSEHMGRIVALGHKEEGLADAFDPEYITKETVERFLTEQAKRSEEFSRKYSMNPPVYTYSDLIAEGYEIEEIPVLNGSLQVPEVKVKIFKTEPGGEKWDQLAEISYRVIEQTKTIVINNFYPKFPVPANGRGRALLRHLLIKPEYTGYHVIAYALEPLQKSFLKMKDFQPMSNIEKEEPTVYDRIGKEMLKELDTFYGESAFIDKPALLESLREDWMMATIYGIVPETQPGEVLSIADKRKNILAAGFPYEIFQVLRAHPEGLSETEMVPLTMGNMPDGHLSETTISRDFGVLRKLGLAFREGSLHKAVPLSPEEWKSIKEILKDLGKRPSAGASDMARELITKKRSSLLISRMPEGTYMVTDQQRNAAVYFDEEFKGLLTKKNRRAIEKAVGINREREENKRALYVTLPEPISLGGRRWTKVYIKGIVFDETEELTPHTGNGYADSKFRAEGASLIKEEPNPSPNGAMGYEYARNEYLQHKRIFNNEYLKENDLLVAGPLGYGLFPNARYYKGKALGFVLLGVDDEMPERGQGLQEEDIPMWGRSLRKLHDAGFHHPYFHSGNISWTDEKVYIHDLDHMTYVEPVKENVKELLSLQFRDLYLWYRQNIHKFFNRETAAWPPKELRAENDSVNAQVGKIYWGKFMRGYSYEMDPIFYHPLCEGLIRMFREIEYAWKGSWKRVDYSDRGATPGKVVLTALKNYVVRNIRRHEKASAKDALFRQRGQTDIKTIFSLAFIFLGSLSMLALPEAMYYIIPSIFFVAAAIVGVSLFGKTDQEESANRASEQEVQEPREEIIVDAPEEIDETEEKEEEVAERETRSVFYTAASLRDLLRNYFSETETLRGIDMGAGDGETTRILKAALEEIFPATVFTGLDNNGVHFKEGDFDVPVQIYDVSQLKDNGAHPELDLITMFAPYPADLEMFIDTAKGLLSERGMILLVLGKSDVLDLFSGKDLFTRLEAGKAWDLLEDFHLVRLSSIDDDVMMRYGHPFVFVYSAEGFEGAEEFRSLFGGEELESQEEGKITFGTRIMEQFRIELEEATSTGEKGSVSAGLLRAMAFGALAFLAAPALLNAGLHKAAEVVEVTAVPWGTYLWLIIPAVIAVAAVGGYFGKALFEKEDDFAPLSRFVRAGQLTVRASDGEDFVFKYIEGPRDGYFRIDIKHGEEHAGQIDVQGDRIEWAFESYEEEMLPYPAIELSPRYRTKYKGLGRALMSLAMAMSRHNGEKRFIVKKFNDNSEKFYLEMGFVYDVAFEEKTALVFNLKKQKIPVIDIVEREEAPDNTIGNFDPEDISYAFIDNTAKKWIGEDFETHEILYVMGTEIPGKTEAENAVVRAAALAGIADENFMIPAGYFAKIKEDFPCTKAEALKIIAQELATNTQHIGPTLGGLLGVKFDEGEDVIRIRYYDTGEGDPLAKKNFGKRYTSTGKKDRGYGLRVINYIVNALNGKIHFNSDVADGTMMTIFIPVGKSVEATGGTDKDQGPGSGAQEAINESISSFKDLVVGFFREKRFIKGVDLGAGVGTKTETVYDILSPHFDEVSYYGLEIDDALVQVPEDKRIQVMSFDVEAPLAPQAVRTQDLVTVLSPPPAKIGQFLKTAKKLVKHNGLVVVSLSAQDMDELLSGVDVAWQTPASEVWSALQGFRGIELSEKNDILARLQRNNKFFVYSPAGTMSLPVERFIDHKYTGDRLYMEPGVFDNEKLVYRLINHLRENEIVLKGKKVWDLGTGSGIMGIYAARQGARVVATDVKSSAYRSATGNVAMAGLGASMDVRKGSFTRPLKETETFDHIFCDPPIYSTKRYSDDPNVYDGDFKLVKDILSEGLERLSEGGSLFMVYPGSKAVEEAKADGIVNLFDVRKAKASLAASGFSLKEGDTGGFFSVWVVTRQERSREAEEEVLFELDLPVSPKSNELTPEMSETVGRINDLVNENKEFLQRHEVVIDDLASEMAMNAMEHGEGGSIKVSCVYGSAGRIAKIRIVVEDKGPGLEDPNKIVRKNLKQKEYSDRGRGLLRITFDPTDLVIESRGKRWVRKRRDRIAPSWFEIEETNNIDEGTRIVAEFDPREEVPLDKMGMHLEKSVIDGERYSMDVIGPGNRVVGFMYAQKSAEMLVEKWYRIGIRGISINPAFRGQGIAKQLFSSFLKEYPTIDLLHGEVRNPVLILMAQEHFSFEPFNAKEENTVYITKGENETRSIWIPNEELRFEYEFGSAETMKNDFTILKEAPPTLDGAKKIYFNTAYRRLNEPQYLFVTREKILEEIKKRAIAIRNKTSFGRLARTQLGSIDKIGVFDLGTGSGSKMIRIQKELEPYFEDVVVMGFDNNIKEVETASKRGRNVKYLDVRKVVKPLEPEAKQEIVTIIAPRPSDLKDLVSAAKKLVADDGIVLISLLGEDMMDLVKGLKLNNELESKECWEILSEFELVTFGFDEKRLWSGQGNSTAFIYSPQGIKAEDQGVDAAGAAERKEGPGHKELANPEEIDNIEEKKAGKKEHMSLKDISYTDLGLEEVDAIIADFDGVDRDQDLKEVSDATISLKRALSARGVHNVTVTGLDMDGFLKRFGGASRAAKVSAGEDYIVLTCTGAIGHAFKASGIPETLKSFDITQLGSETDRLELKGLLMDSLQEVLAENNMQLQGSRLATWSKEQQITLDTRPVPEVNALRYKIAARLKGKLQGIEKFSNISVICSGGAIDITALTKARAAIKMIKALRLKKIVIAGDSAGTEDEPGNDRSLFKLTQKDLIEAGIDWEVDLIKTYVGKEGVYDLPEDVLVAEEDAKETQPMIDMYTAILQAKAHQELKDVLVSQDFSAAKRDEAVVIGVESSWVPDMQASAVQGLLNELTRKGFSNVRIVRASGEGLAGELDKAIGKTGAPLANVVILGAREVISSGAFEKFKSSADTPGAFFAGVDLPEGFPDNGYTRLLEMITLAVKMAFGEVMAEDPYIETIEEGDRVYRFIPQAQAIEFEELKKIYTLQKKLLTSA